MNCEKFTRNQSTNILVHCNRSDPNRTYKNVDIKFTLRLPEELHQEIAIYSNKHNVSMNTLILNCIEYAMSNREDK